jgi:antagonist of KipI
MGGVEVLEVLSPGLLTTVQDLGRSGFGRYGVAPSGALDSFALRVGNLLVGNPESEAGLETTLLGLRLRVLSDILIAVTGADLQPQLNKQPLPMWQSSRVKTGEEIVFVGPRSGCRAYLTWAGGIQVDPVMKSKSTNLSSGFGGYSGRPLQKGDVLRAPSVGVPLPAAGRSLPSDWIPSYPSRWPLRVVWGPQDDDFSDAGRAVFLQGHFAVSPQSDRTGIRLQGPVIERRPAAPESIISEGLVTGAIQVPGDGQPIIILGETVTGGYRKIAAVIAADLPLLGQIKPGDTVGFDAVSLEQAHLALQDREERIRIFKDRISGTQT